MSKHNSLGLDPKKFTYVKSDEKSTTLRHKDGHTLTIAHNILSPKMKTQLQALSKVGEEAQTASQAQEAQDQAKRKPMAKGGEVDCQKPHYDAGGVVDQVQKFFSGDFGATTRAADAERAHMDHIAAPAVAYDAKPKAKYAEGTPDHPVSADDKDLASYDSDTHSALTDLKNAWDRVKAKGISGLAKTSTDPDYGRSASHPQPMRVVDDETPEVTAPTEEVAPAQATPGLVPQPQAAAPTAPAQPQSQGMAAGVPEFGRLAQQAYGSGMAGIAQQEKAAEQLAGQQQESLQNQIHADAAARTAFQSGAEDIEQERRNHINDIQNGYVDPNKYWAGYTAANGDQIPGHSKVAAGIGMILAGFNPTNRPNAAVDFLKTQIDQSLQSQAKNLDSQHNLLRANLEHFRNYKDATEMTRVMMTDSLNHQLGLAAAQAATPQAKAAALMAQSQLAQSILPTAMNMQIMRGFQHLNDNNPDPSNTSGAEAFLNTLRAVPGHEPQAKDLEARIVPGVGISKVPIPEGARSEITAHQKLQDALTDLQQFTKGHTTIVPGTKDYTVGQQKAMIVQTMLREGLLNTVYREGEQPLLDKLIKGNPANLLKDFNTLPQIKELMRNNAVQSDSLKHQFGLPTNEMVHVISPDGRAGSVPKTKLQEALKSGFKVR